MKNNKLIILAASAGFLGVALGAFGAHGLKTYVNSDMIETYRTGVQYHLIHAVVLLVLSINGTNKFFKAFWFILIGIILFSFSLYLYAVTSAALFAAITPLGGVSFLIGWLLILLEASKGRTVDRTVDRK